MVRRLAIKMKRIAIKEFFLRQFGDKNADTISGSKVVSIADCHSGDRGLITDREKIFDELR